MYYMKALQVTIDYIESHLYKDFTLSDLEQENGFSRCHFSRLFHLFTGYKISEYIRSRRLTVACERLLHTMDRQVDIALDLQFSSQDAFTRSFKKVVGVTPGQYRKTKQHRFEVAPLNVESIIWIQGGMEMKPIIKTIEKMYIVGMVYEGKNQNNEIPEMWQRFIPRMHEIQHTKGNGRSYGICQPLEEKLEDVDLENPSDFKYLAGLEVSSIEDIPEGMVYWEVKKQKYAVFTHTGSVELLGDTYKAIYSKWLPESGYDVVFTYDFEMYDASFKPGDEQSKMYVYIPIK